MKKKIVKEAKKPKIVVETGLGPDAEKKPKFSKDTQAKLDTLQSMLDTAFTKYGDSAVGEIAQKAIEFLRTLTNYAL